MKEVGVHEAKTHLPSLLNEAQAGATILITRRGRPIAQLVPLSPRQQRVAKAIEAIREFGRRNRLDGFSIKDLITEGRRY